MIILEDILSQEIVQRLGWTLLHFIWQAAAVAFILVILLRLLRKSTANVRYIIACLALALIVLLPVITIQLVPVSESLTAANFEPAPTPTVMPAAEMPEPETIVLAKPSEPESAPVVPYVPFKQRAIDTLEPALPYIVSGWLIGVFGLSIWHLGGWTQLHRLKRRMVKQVDSTLLNKLKVLTQKLKVKQTVRLMESALVQIPTVVGWLRPVILLPASALTGLSSEQLEAIVAHELAHIKRFDYLINILQTVVETLGFYHPAVWWVSYKIRAERENCCDDMAISIFGDRVSYAGALASMEEIRAGQPKLAVAASGGNLFRRICRLLGKDSAGNTGLSWVPAATAILLIIALAIPTTLALTNKSDPLLTEPQAKLQVENVIQIPSADSQEKTDIQIDAKKVQSAHKLKILGLAVAMFAEDLDDNLPESLEELKPYIRDGQDFDWLRDNVIYINKGKAAQRNALFIPIAYDSTLPEKADGTNVLFLDFSVRFVDIKEFEKLDIKRAEFLIDVRFLSVSEDFLKNISLDLDSRGMAQSNLILTPETLKSLDFSKTQSLIINDLDVNLLLSALKIHTDSKVLANPKILTREGKTAEITTAEKIPILTGYTEPNNPSEKPQPKFGYVDTGISMSLRPKLTPNNNIYMQFEFEIITVTGFEEKAYKGKYPYKQPTVQSISQATQYTAKNGQTLLFGAHKIADHQDGQTEQKDLLVLITTHTIGSSEQDKSTKTENLIITEPPRITIDGVTQPAIPKSRTEIRKDNEQKPSQVQAREDFELPEITKRMESAKKLSSLGKALLIYANDHDDKYPNSLRQLPDYLKAEDFHWILENVEYLASEKTLADRPDTVTAYDKKLLIKEKGTNVLFNDCHVSFKKAQELKKLGINIIGTEFLIETQFLAITRDFIQNINHNADSPDEAKELLKLKSKLLAAKTQCPTLNDKNISLLLKAVRAHKDSKVLATPDVICLEDKTAEISVMSKEYYYITGYTEPNDPSEKPQPKLEKVEEGISLSLKPKLTPNNNIEMDFKIETAQFLDFEERKLKGEGPKVQRRIQSLYYRVQNGETFLLGGDTIADRQDGRTEQKELLVLITTHVFSPLEQDKPAQAQDPTVIQPTTTTTNITTQPTIAKSITETRKDDEREKSKPVSEQRRRRGARSIDGPLEKIDNKNQVVQKLFKLKHYNPSMMKQVILPLVSENGHISADERNNSLLVIDTVKNLMHLERIIEQLDVPKTERVVTQIFEIRYGDPVEITELLKKLINGRPENSAIIEKGKEPIVLIPQPVYKWIIAKGSAKDINQIGQWIKKLDISKTTMGLDPIDKAVHEQLDTIVDLSDLAPGMSFGEVVEKLENSVDPPLQIQPIWKDLLENAEVEQATPAGMDPLPHVKLRKALEILLTSVSSTGMPKPTYVVDEGVILIGTVGMLPPKRGSRVYDTSDLVGTEATKVSPENIKKIGQSIDKHATRNNIGLDPVDAAVYEQLETIVDLSDLGPGTSFGEVIEKLKNSVSPPLQIQPIWKDLLDNAEVEQETPASMDPLTDIKLSKALEILIASATSSQPGEFGEITYVVDDGVILIGSEELLPHKMLPRVYDISDLVEDTADANNLIRSITQTIEPDSWYKLSEKGEGTIMAYPLRQPKNFAVMQTYRIHQKITRFLEDMRSSGKKETIQRILDDIISSRREREKTTPVIKPHELQILRQQYINNDSRVKFLSEKITEVENELIELRQKFTQSHPDVRKKAALLRAWKNALLERKKEVGKSFDDIMTKEIHQTNRETINKLLDELRKTKEHQQPLQQAQEQIAKLLDESKEPMTPLEHIQKQLDELIKQQEAPKVTEPNVFVPQVPLVSNTFIDTPLIDALQYIAAAANVTIIPDETVTGIVSCTLKEVTVETALDIVLGGTPYIWKKTPYYYLVASGVEPSEITERMESAKKLSNLGKALLIYANDHDDKYPNSLLTFSEHMNWQDFSWIRQNVEYLASGKTPADPPDTVIAYDKKLLAKGNGTNVLYNDCHVGFVKPKALEKLGISESEIMIETQFWSVTEDFLKDVGLDANFENLSDDWRGHLAATYPEGPSGKPYGLMIDDLHLTFLLRAIQAHKGSKAIVAPRVLAREGTKAEMRFLTEEYYYITGYNEPNSPSEEPQPKREKVDIGTRIWLTPKLTENSRNINMDLKLEITQLKGIIEGKYKEKYPTYKPIVDVISMNLPCTIPDGKSMLICGLKIKEHVTKKPDTPGLKDLPLIGAVFSGKDKTTEPKMLLVLVKPITNPQQKAAKILPGQEDSEGQIKRLTEQLDKKIKRPTN